MLYSWCERLEALLTVSITILTKSPSSGIIKPSYFDPEYEPVVKYIQDYYSKYSATPSLDQIEAEVDLEFEETQRVTKDRIESTCEDVEKFCGNIVYFACC